MQLVFRRRECYNQHIGNLRKRTETDMHHEEKNLPELHTIIDRKPRQNASQNEGAAAFSGRLNHANSRYYVFNDYYNMESDETLHILPHFETYQQTTEYTCGAASALMVLNWFGKTKYHEKVLERLVESRPTRGTTVENIADFFDLIGWNVESHADTTRKFDSPKAFEAFVIDRIDRGIPIMIDWVDWAGHWQVLIGIDTCGSDEPFDDVLIFADPYDVTDHFQDGYYIFPLGRFFGMWQEGPCADKNKPYLQPYVAVWPKDEEHD